MPPDPTGFRPHRSQSGHTVRSHSVGPGQCGVPVVCCVAAGGLTSRGAAAPRCGAAAIRPSRSTMSDSASRVPICADTRRLRRLLRSQGRHGVTSDPSTRISPGRPAPGRRTPSSGSAQFSSPHPPTPAARPQATCPPPSSHPRRTRPRAHSRSGANPIAPSERSSSDFEGHRRRVEQRVSRIARSFAGWSASRGVIGRRAWSIIDGRASLAD
jgi:hypothetical protein